MLTVATDVAWGDSGTFGLRKAGEVEAMDTAEDEEDGVSTVSVRAGLEVGLCDGG